MLNFKYEFGYFPDIIGEKSTTLTSRVFDAIQVNLVYIYHLEMVLDWTIPKQWGNCEFDVYRSETGYDSWEKITSQPTSANYIRIHNEIKESKYTSSFYVVETTINGNRKVRSSPISLSNRRSDWVELRAREIRRREWLLLTKFTGVKSLIFRRKTFGKRCPECWDVISEKTTKDNCNTCLGTSFEGGYFTGYSTYIQYEPTPNNANLSYQGKVEPNTISAWTVDYPEVTNFDIVIRVPDWRAYRVEVNTPTELQTVTVKQVLTLTELDKRSIEYKLANQVVPNDWETKISIRGNLVNNSLGPLSPVISFGTTGNYGVGSI